MTVGEKQSMGKLDQYLCRILSGADVSVVDAVGLVTILAACGGQLMSD